MQLRRLGKVVVLPLSPSSHVARSIPEVSRSPPRMESYECGYSPSAWTSQQAEDAGQVRDVVRMARKGRRENSEPMVRLGLC